MRWLLWSSELQLTFWQNTCQDAFCIVSYFVQKTAKVTGSTEIFSDSEKNTYSALDHFWLACPCIYQRSKGGTSSPNSSLNYQLVVSEKKKKTNLQMPPCGVHRSTIFQPQNTRRRDAAGDALQTDGLLENHWTLSRSSCANSWRHLRNQIGHSYSLNLIRMMNLEKHKEVVTQSWIVPEACIQNINHIYQMFLFISKYKNI